MAGIPMPTGEDVEPARDPSLTYWQNVPGAYRMFNTGSTGQAETPAEDRPPTDACNSADEESSLVHVPNAILVEEEEVYDGTPLEPPVPLWRQNRIRCLVAAFGAVVTVLLIALGLSLSEAALEPPALDLPSPSLPSHPAPFTTCDGQLLQVAVCLPKVAMHGNVAIITRGYTDVQFFASTNSSFELITSIDIDYFPDSVAIDGNTAVITSRNIKFSSENMKFVGDEEKFQNPDPDITLDNLNGLTNLLDNDGPGDVYVYECNRRGAWSLAAVIQPSGLAQAGFGLVAAIDGDVIVLGVPDIWQNDNAYNEEKVLGCVYVYRRDGDSWTEEARLTPPGDAAPKFLSGSVSIRGGTIAVGDYYRNGSAGAVFVYEFDPLSKSWNPVDRVLVNPNCSKYFGSAVILTNEEELLVKCWGGQSGGAVYSYERQGVGKDFVLRQSIGFNTTVRSMAVDGRAMAVAESRKGVSLAIQFFMQTSSAWNWVQVAALDQPLNSEQFGRQMALSGNDTLIASFQNVYLFKDVFS